VRAFVLPQIPYTHIAAAVATNQLPLIRMYNHIIDRAIVMVNPLYATRSRVPYLDRAVFRTRDHPFALAVEGHASDIPGVAVKGEEWIGIRGADVVEFDIVVARSSEVALVGRDAEAIDLRVGVLDGTGAYAGEGFPEADRVVVASCGEFRRSTRKELICERLAYLCKELRSLLLAHFCQRGLRTRIVLGILGQFGSFALVKRAPLAHVPQIMSSMLNTLRSGLFLKLILHLRN